MTVLSLSSVASTPRHSERTLSSLRAYPLVILSVSEESKFCRQQVLRSLHSL